MAFNIDEDAVRNEVKDLLLTDKISSGEVLTAIADSKQIVLTTTYETFDSSITDSSFIESMNIAVKLLACSKLIRANYSTDELALKLADSYTKDSNNLVNSIVKGKELSKVDGVTKFDTVRVYRTNSDNRANDYSDKMKSYYR